MSSLKWIVLTAVFGAQWACGPCCLAADQAGEDETRSVTMVYFADLHAQLVPHPELFWNGDRDEMTMAGGVARIAATVESIRKERLGRVLFLDAGDTIQGSAAAAWTEGRAVVAPINSLKLDLGIPGNWEVVYGPEALRKRTAEYKHPTVAANIRNRATGKALFPPYVVKDLGGVRVGIIGFTDPDVPERQPPSYSKGLTFDGVEVLPPLVDELRRREHADVIVLVTHIGLPKSIRLAETLRGVDFILSGDTHERTYEPIVRGETWVVEPGSFGSFLGRVDFRVQRGKIIDRKWELIELRADRFAEDAAVRRIVDETLEPFRPKLDRVIGRSDVPLLRYNVVETNLDDVLADALREAACTEIALSNGFRFSPPTLAGPLHESDVWNWLPITTKLKAGKVTGQQIRQFWEQEAEHVFSADPTKLFGGWLPRPSGMTVRLAARAPKGQRVREIRIGDEPLRMDRIYTLAACEREGDEPDKLCRIAHVSEPRVLSIDAHAAVRSYLAKHSPVQMSTAGRVVAEDLPTNTRSQLIPQTLPRAPRTR